MNIIQLLRAVNLLAMLLFVAGCGQEEQAQSATALEASSGTTDAEGRVSFKSGSNDLQVSVQDEQGKPLAGMGVQHLGLADQQGIFVAYDLSGKYYPNVAFDSAFYGRREGSLKEGMGKDREQGTLLLETVIVLGLADLAYAIYKNLSESLPASFVKGSPNVRFCASRAWFERETKIATGVILMAAPGGTIVKKGIGFAANKVVGSMVLKELDDQYGGGNAGYTVVVPSNEPVCESSNVVNDLCVLDDQASGLKIWNTAPFVVSTEGPCDPKGSTPNPVASSGPRCDGAERLCDDFSESANTTLWANAGGEVVQDGHLVEGWLTSKVMQKVMQSSNDHVRIVVDTIKMSPKFSLKINQANAGRVEFGVQQPSGKVFLTYQYTGFVSFSKCDETVINGSDGKFEIEWNKSELTLSRDGTQICSLLAWSDGSYYEAPTGLRVEVKTADPTRIDIIKVE